jgi:hypothetical protein
METTLQELIDNAAKFASGVGECRSCKYWEEVDTIFIKETGSRPCGNEKFTSMIESTLPLDCAAVGFIFTLPNFGCVHFEMMPRNCT